MLSYSKSQLNTISYFSSTLGDMDIKISFPTHKTCYSRRVRSFFIIVNEPSASIIPDKNQGLTEDIKVEENLLTINCLEGILSEQFLSKPLRVYLKCINLLLIHQLPSTRCSFT